MKRIILSAFFLASVYALSAQEVTVYRLGTTTSNPGYSVPMQIRTTFQTTYPSATLVTWEPVSDWWVASYTIDNRINHVYYNTQPYYLIRNESFHVALPVLQTYVPDAVITAAISRFGNSLYDITKMKSASNVEIYNVRLLENGVSHSIWMDDQGTEVTDVYKVKVDEDGVKIKADKDQ